MISSLSRDDVSDLVVLDLEVRSLVQVVCRFWFGVKDGLGLQGGGLRRVERVGLGNLGTHGEGLRMVGTSSRPGI